MRACHTLDFRFPCLAGGHEGINETSTAYLSIRRVQHGTAFSGEFIPDLLGLSQAVLKELSKAIMRVIVDTPEDIEELLVTHIKVHINTSIRKF